MTASQLSLRPLGVGEILDRAVRLYRRHFFTFIGIIALVQVPLVLAQMALNILSLQTLNRPGETSPELLLATSIGIMMLSVLGYIFVQSLGTAALTRAIADSYLGRPVSLGGAYRKIGPVWRTVIAAMILVMLLALGLTAWWLLVPCVGWLTGLGMLLFLMMVISPMVAPVIVVERQRAGASLRRAWDLARRRFWPVVGFVLVLTLLVAVFMVIPSLLAQSLVSFGLIPMGGSFLQQQMLSTLLGSLIGLALGLIIVPFQLTAMTLLYFDLRIRTEGFDLAVLAASLEQPLTPPASEEPLAVAPAAEVSPADVALQSPPAPRTSLITGQELAYFLLLTIGLAAVYIVLIVGLSALMAVSMGGV
ncbi:MAG TPA: hypothetical protein PK170_10855 [Anaerolineae bacterium]|nr:hypothetical protein [Anaerolineae bacterium]